MKPYLRALRPPKQRVSTPCLNGNGLTVARQVLLVQRLRDLSRIRYLTSSTSKLRAIGLRRVTEELSACPAVNRGETVHESVRKYNPPVESLHLEEYRALRAAIAQRGALRTVLFVTCIVGWALAATLVAALLALPLAALLPLIVLAAGFEAVHALHVGAERIGRYLYVRYESGIGGANGGVRSTAPLMWEGSIAAFGSGHRAMPFGGGPSGAHFAAIFTLAVTLNAFVTALGATAPELAAIAVIHALVIARVVAAHRGSLTQRQSDQARFEQILSR